MNPITDELSDDAKAELAAVFAEMKARYEAFDRDLQLKINNLRARGYRPWDAQWHKEIW